MKKKIIYTILAISTINVFYGGTMYKLTFNPFYLISFITGFVFNCLIFYANAERGL